MLIPSYPDRRHISAVILLFLSASACAEDSVEVGWIDGFDGPSESFVILRDRGKVDGAIFEPIYEGDWIVIREGGYSLSVGLGGGKSLELTYETTPYLVTSTGEPPGLAGNLMAWVQDLFMDSHRDHGVDPAQSMVIRSYQAPEKLSFPLLNKVGKQKIAVGQSIILSWQGGQKPYGIRVLAAGRQAPLLEMHGLLDGRVQLDSAAWVPGSYSVEISAGQDRDQVVAGEFEVVDADIVPAVPANYAEELDASSMPENSKAVLRSAWLSKQGDGEWSLQAYQQVVALPQSYYPAYLLQQSLVLGE